MSRTTHVCVVWGSLRIGCCDLVAARRSTVRLPSSVSPRRPAYGPGGRSRVLLDHAAHLATRGEAEAATAAVGEARGIGQRLSCQPLLDRADTIQPARPRTAAP